MAALGLLLLRLIVGLTLAAHGAQKVFGWWGGSGIPGWTQAMTRLRIRPAAPWAWISALAELVGGLMLALGFLSPMGNLAIAGAMLVAIATVHFAKGFWNTKGGFEFNLTILAAVFALALTGPGVYSLDHAMRINLPEPATLLVGTVAMIVGVTVTLATRAPKPATEARAQTT
jgi:putative oxidoreductase